MKSLFYIRIYLLGVLVHLFYLVGLNYYTPIPELNWAHADTSTYTEPARSFLEHGKFLSGGEPDYRRTIGYPAFVSLAMWISDQTGGDWRVVIYCLQAFVFAMAYPATVYIGLTLFNIKRSSCIVAISIMMLGGAFVSYSAAILSDALFATLFICSVASGIAAIKMPRRGWPLMHILLAATASLTRPILLLFPFAMLALCLGYAKKNNLWALRAVKVRVVLMFLGALISVQLPALRNWINHGVYTSSELGSMALYDYLAREVLFNRGFSAKYQAKSDEIIAVSGAENLGYRIRARTEEALKTFAAYPATTAAAMIYNTILNSLEFHWNNTLFYLFRVTWYKDYEGGGVLWSPIPYAIGLLFVMFYGVVYLGVALFLLAIRKNAFFIIAAALFLFPLVPSATNYQGARFRLWLEPFLILSSLAVAEHAMRLNKKSLGDLDDHT